ncbi:endonuclease domain-containing protein [Streptomyces sp. NPDC059063]
MSAIRRHQPAIRLCGHCPGAVVDHGHQSGPVRGLLRALCNAGLKDCRT